MRVREPGLVHQARPPCLGFETRSNCYHVVLSVSPPPHKQERLDKTTDTDTPPHRTPHRHQMQRVKNGYGPCMGMPGMHLAARGRRRRRQKKPSCAASAAQGSCGPGVRCGKVPGPGDTRLVRVLVSCLAEVRPGSRRGCPSNRSPAGGQMGMKERRQARCQPLASV